MSVTNYKPKSDLGCRYSYDKLDDVVYLVSQDHVKDIIIDNGEAYISGLTEVPIRIDCFNIAFAEETSLDERYKFTKTLTFSVNGFATHKDFEGKFYAIIKSKDGTLWMVNVDFPSSVTYTFNLSKDSFRTDFTFTTPSNFPTLRLSSDFNQGSRDCIGYLKCGIKELHLLEKDYCSFDPVSGTIYTYDNEFKDVEYLGETCTFTEEFDGENVTTTIEFKIAFDAYKSSWHYNLIEFLKNLYSAIVVTSCGNALLGGFNFGLQPQFKVEANTSNGNSDIITVTLIESSLNGSSMVDNWIPENVTDRLHRYLAEYYECVSNGVAKYLVREKMLKNGTPTGEYEALEGYEEDFPELNIVGTFDTVKTFPNANCHDDVCTLETNMPGTITYTQATCYTYNLMATCDWYAGIMPSHLSITPSSGVAYSAYTITLCNSETPTSAKTDSFTISYGDKPNVKTFKVILTPNGILSPQIQYINCLKQNVNFIYNAQCPITVTSISPKLTYQLNEGLFIVNVPRNESIVSGITWDIIVRDCSGNTGTCQIIQDKTYEKWVDTSGYLCDSGNSYVLQARYTGTTSGDVNTLTGESRKGALIQSGDSRCGDILSRWVYDGKYYCADGDKYEALEEEVSFDGGTTWSKTGITRYGSLIESGSTDCQSGDTEYKWELTNEWVCDSQTIKKLAANYSDSSTYNVDCNTSTTLSLSEVRGHSTPISAMTNAEIGLCVTNIGDNAFSYCTSLTSVTIPSGVTSIDLFAFSRCESLRNIEIPNSVITIGDTAFFYCTSLTSITIPDSVTSIGDGAFTNCTGLTNVNLGSGVTSISRDAFQYCSSLTSIALPSGVTSIGMQAFQNCSSLTSVTIPSGVTTIGNNAFTSCSNLSGITCLATTPPTLGSWAFGNTNKCPIYVPSGSVNAYKSASGWSDYASRIQAIGS